MVKIVYTGHSIGNNFGEVIEINRHLKEYPKLFNAVLGHELAHTKDFFTIRDLKLDLTQKVSSWDMLKFIVKHPKSLFQFVPFYYSKNYGFVYDINLIIIYLVTICIFSLTYFIAVRV